MAIEIEVAYASSSRQAIIHLTVPDTCTIQQAIQLSGLIEQFPELNSTQLLQVGIFNKPRSLDWLVQAGDRVEIYRPLQQDPKAARLKRAKEQRQKKTKK